VNYTTSGTGPLFWLCLAGGAIFLFWALITALDTEFQARMANKWRLHKRNRRNRKNYPPAHTRSEQKPQRPPNKPGERR
jgi:hypothetical protein